MDCDRIEIYTEPYATAFLTSQYERELKNIKDTATFARQHGLEVNAGHDLTHDNIPALVAKVPDLKEISVGHHLICHAP